MTEEKYAPKEAQDLRELEVKLIPDEAPTVSEMVVKLEDLPSNYLLVSPEPTKELLDSLTRYGLMQPIVIQKAFGWSREKIEAYSYSGGVYHVLGGRRRIKAARKLGWVEIEAIHLSEALGGLSSDSLTVGLNSTAKPNAMAEVEAIRHMLAAGYGEREISEATGLGLSTLRKRTRLLSLPTDLQRALRTGAIGVGAAEMAASLSDGDQAVLLKLLEERGKISAKDVRNLRKAATRQAAAALDLGELDTPGIDDLGGPQDPERQSAGISNPVADRHVEHLKGRVKTFEHVDRRTAEARWSDDDIRAVRTLLTLARTNDQRGEDDGRTEGQ